MLVRFTITPGALGVASSSSAEALELGIGCLNDLCRGEGLFADLRDGGWGRTVDGVGPLAKRFLTFARKERRLIRVPSQAKAEPDRDEEWLWEAQRFHDAFPCHALITNKDLAASYPEAPVISIESLNLSSWWAERSADLRIEKNTSAYLKALELVLRHANSLMFIDPHIDPLKDNYVDFPSFLLGAGVNRQPPLIELHRASWRMVDGRKQVQPLGGWIADFQSWSDRFARAGIKADVFLWGEDMHDRCLISDIVGIQLPWGFDTALGLGSQITTWHRLGSRRRDEIQKEYDRASGIHGLVGSFEIGASGSAAP